MPDPTVTGVVLSLAAAGLWAVSPMCFASAGRRIGSFPVVLLRSLLATFLLVGLLPACALTSGGWPRTPNPSQVLWLSVSGLTGMGLGDVLAYEALVLLGVRRTMQILTLAPAAAVLLGWTLLDERLSLLTLGGIALVLAGTSYAVLARPADSEASREPGRVSPAGLFCAAGGAICIGAGAVAARQAFRVGELDAVVATVIRVGSAAVLLWLVPLGLKDARRTVGYLREGFVLSRLLPGTLLGPFAGMLCYLYALKHLEAGLVSTLSAMSPLFILPLVAVRYRVRVGADVIAATVLALAGVALICLR